MGLTCGSLFSGAGLLDIGLHLAGLEHLWMCESDPWRRALLRTRFGVPVYDDVRTIRGQASMGVEPVDVIAGGFPCKGASSAGKREGFGHAETFLWREMARVVRDLRPRYVLIENVANILGMAAGPMEPPGSLWGTVVGDLVTLGYGHIVWDCIPAAAVGAPHLRDRVFAIAAYADEGRRRAGTERTASGAGGGRRLDGQAAGGGAESAADADAAGRRERGGAIAGGAQLAAVERARPDAPNPADAGRLPSIGAGQQRRVGGDAGAIDAGVAVDWGEYEPAIRRWEAIHGPAPKPLIRRVDDGNPAVRRMRARVDRSRLSALGDGVHVYAGWLAGRYLSDLAAGLACTSQL